MPKVVNIIIDRSHITQGNVALLIKVKPKTNITKL